METHSGHSDTVSSRSIPHVSSRTLANPAHSSKLRLRPPSAPAPPRRWGSGKQSHAHCPEPSPRGNQKKQRGDGDKRVAAYPSEEISAERRCDAARSVGKAGSHHPQQFVSISSTPFRFSGRSTGHHRPQGHPRRSVFRNTGTGDGSLARLRLMSVRPARPTLAMNLAGRRVPHLLAVRARDRSPLSAA